MVIVELWLPILVSAVFVFVVSSLIHMALPIHKNDVAPLPGETELLAAMREHGVKRGSYMFPCPASMKDASTPEHAEKCNLGPVGFMTIMDNGLPNMGKSLLQWFAFCLVIGAFTAYIGKFSLEPGAAPGDVFRVTATISILGYAAGNVMDSIWKGVSWAISFKFVFDGILYGLAAGAAFAWLWPAAA